MDWRVPILPIWRGLVINTAIATVAWIVVLFMPSAIGQIRSARRTRLRHCPKCRYDLKATPAGLCPECGAAQTIT